MVSFIVFSNSLILDLTYHFSLFTYPEAPASCTRTLFFVEQQTQTLPPIERETLVARHEGHFLRYGV